jgi:glucokinase
MAARLTLGIDLGGTTTLLAVVDAHNAIVWDRRLPTRPEAGFADVGRRIEEAAAEGRARYPYEAAGVAVAAHVHAHTGVLVSSPNLAFREVELRSYFERAWGLPLVVENDVNAAAYGEYVVASGPREPLLAVYVGTGVGGGLVVDGRLFRGADGFAAEIGHVPVVAEGGEPCGCGRRGCLEAYAGGAAIVRRAAARLRPGREPLASVDDVARAAAAGEAACRAVLEEAAAALGLGLAVAVNLYNPGTLVLGGGVARGWPEIIPRAPARMRAAALPAALAELVTAPAQLGPRAGVVGAAALARELLAASRRP